MKLVKLRGGGWSLEADQEARELLLDSVDDAITNAGPPCLALSRHVERPGFWFRFFRWLGVP